MLYHSASAFHEDSPNLLYRLAVLLDECLRKNIATGITGVLAYHGGQFVQVLEGSAYEVDRCFEGIRRDLRHQEVRLIAREPCDRRLFMGWAMGYLGYEHDLREIFARARAIDKPSALGPMAEDMARLLT